MPDAGYFNHFAGYSIQKRDGAIQPLRLEDGENSPKNSTILTVNLDYITSAL